MAKQRVIDTRFWIDDYISQLNPHEKLIFLYLITNPSTNICGVYEIPLRTIVSDTGISKEEVEATLEKFRISKKAFFGNGWISIWNFIKFQNISNGKIREAIKIGLSMVPEHIKQLQITHGYNIYDTSYLNSNSNSNSNPKSNMSIFPKFWERYPRRQRRQDAEKAWGQIEGLDDVLLAKILKGVDNQKMSETWRVDGGKYIPYPARWLNERRWEDEVMDGEQGGGGVINLNQKKYTK